MATSSHRVRAPDRSGKTTEIASTVSSRALNVTIRSSHEVFPQPVAVITGGQNSDGLTFVAKAEAAGAQLGGTDDYGFMYQRQFDDPDGNQFAPFWTDPDGPPAG